MEDRRILFIVFLSTTLVIGSTGVNGEDRTGSRDTVQGLEIQTISNSPNDDLSSDDNLLNGTNENSGYSRSQLPRFQQIELEYYIKHASQSPFCVLFKDTDTSLLEETLQALQDSDQLSDLSDGKIKIGVYSLFKKLHGSNITVTSPTLRCYLSSASYHDYDGLPEMDTLKQWLIMTFAERDSMMTEACHSNIDEMISKFRTTLLAFPGEDSYSKIESLLQQLKSKSGNDDVQFLIVPANSAHEKPLVSRFKVDKYPTLLMLDGQGWKKGSISVYKRFHKSEVKKEIIELYLRTMKTSLRKLSLVDFQKEVIEGRTHRSPIVLCFFAAWGQNVNGYVSVFDRMAVTLGETGADIRFGLIDIKQESKIIPRYVKVVSAKNVPFVVVFWWSKDNKKKDTKLHVVQKVFSDQLPTPSNMYDFLVTNDIPFKDKNGKQLHYTPWCSHTDLLHISHGYSSVSPVCGCHDNTTGMSADEENFYYPSYHVHKSAANSEQCEHIDVDEQKSIDSGEDEETETPSNILVEADNERNIPILTDATWRQVVESSLPPSQGLFGQSRSVKSAAIKAILVIFIQAECGSCERKMDMFRNIAVSVSYMDGGVAFLVNCTDSPLTCQQQNIVGFPTLIVYRKLGWLESERCVSSRLHSHYSRVDYHGSLLEADIMEWFSQATVPAVNHVGGDDMQNTPMIEDIRIVGSVYPKSVAGKYLPQVAGVDSWFPMQCFQLVCERLYGKAVCYAEKTPDIPSREFDHEGEEEQDMIVAQVKMIRRDGIKVLLFKLGVPLISTLEDETDNQIHDFHTPHKYELQAGQRCEDDHATCTDVLVDFVEDHRRLPITHLTKTSFHTSSKWMSSGRPTDLLQGTLPVIIALVHKDNITDDAQFMKVLTSVAYELYNQVIVATLDVDEFPAWAAQFVPADYRRHVIEHTMEISEDRIPSLYVYPRLCMVNWKDHRRAAFYPPLTEFRLVSRTDETTAFRREDILKFTRRVLDSGDDVMVRTEHF